MTTPRSGWERNGWTTRKHRWQANMALAAAAERILREGGHYALRVTVDGAKAPHMSRVWWEGDWAADEINWDRAARALEAAGIDCEPEGGILRWALPRRTLPLNVRRCTAR